MYHTHTHTLCIYEKACFDIISCIYSEIEIILQFIIKYLDSVWRNTIFYSFHLKLWVHFLYCFASSYALWVFDIFTTEQVVAFEVAYLYVVFVSNGD